MSRAPYRWAAAAGSAGEANYRRRPESVRGQNTIADHLEERARSERHGIEQQTTATCFATPSFVFAEPVLPVADALLIRVRLKPDPADDARLKSRPTDGRRP